WPYAYFVIYKFVQELHFCITAGDGDNEVIILQGSSDSVVQFTVLLGDVEKTAALKNLDMILLSYMVGKYFLWSMLRLHHRFF
ncbi:Os09g0251450, partial [Oryza sativa Japonica Group]